MSLDLINASVSHCFKKSSLTIIWNNLDLSNYRCMKINLEFRKKLHILRNIFLCTFNKIFFPQRWNWLRDTTNAYEQEDSLLNNSVLNYSRCLDLFMNTSTHDLVFSMSDERYHVGFKIVNFPHLQG